MTYSRKVFIPLTRLCRDVCHYCTFATTPRRAVKASLSPQQMLEIARAGEKTGCREALFTLGDRPEDWYPAARKALAELGYASTLDYLGAMAALVLAETGLLPPPQSRPHGRCQPARLRPAAASMGALLETTADRLPDAGGPHHGSPDKLPAVRLEAL